MVDAIEEVGVFGEAESLGVNMFWNFATPTVTLLRFLLVSIWLIDEKELIEFDLEARESPSPLKCFMDLVRGLSATSFICTVLRLESKMN
jgi:hypothetical protein